MGVIPLSKPLTGAGSYGWGMGVAVGVGETAGVRVAVGMRVAVADGAAADAGAGVRILTPTSPASRAAQIVRMRGRWAMGGFSPADLAG